MEIYDESGLPLGPVEPHPIECEGNAMPNGGTTDALAIAEKVVSLGVQRNPYGIPDYTKAAAIIQTFGDACVAKEAEKLRRQLSSKVSMDAVYVAESYQGDIDKLEADNAALRERVAVLEGAVRWALGEGDSDFGDNVPANAPRMWWRSELRKRAALASGKGA